LSKRSQPLYPYIRFAIAVRASGWVGLGISEAGGMKGADVALFSMAEPGRIVDSYILDDREVLTDDCQDWELMQSTQKDGWLIVEMKRPLDTKDMQDRKIMDDSHVTFAPTRLIAAWGDQSSVGYHGLNRARTSVKLFAEESLFDAASVRNRLEQVADGSFDIMADNYLIPAKETTYANFCVTYDELKEKYGFQDGETVTLIGAGATVWQESEPYVHHFIVYGTYAEDSCKRSDVNMLFGWAPGEPGFVFPSDVGLPILGDGHFKSFRIEMHYNNPGLVENVRDSSGMTLFYSMEERTHQLGMLQLGDPLLQLSGDSIGEGLTEWNFQCDSTCSVLALAGSPVTVLSESLHMHKTGVKMTNELIRNSKVVHSATADFFDFDQQGSLRIQEELYTIQPGDTFRTSCFYRDGTEFGTSSQEEMCVAFLLYYPAKRLKFGTFEVPWLCAYGTGQSICSEELTFSSLPDVASLDRAFGSSTSDFCSETSDPKDVVNFQGRSGGIEVGVGFIASVLQLCTVVFLFF